MRTSPLTLRSPPERSSEQFSEALGRVCTTWSQPPAWRALKVMPVLLAARVAIVRGGYRVVRDDERVVRTCGGFAGSLSTGEAQGFSTRD